MKAKREVKTIGIRISKELLEKLRYVATRDCRSVSSAARIAIEDHIQEFEREHGEIKL